MNVTQALFIALGVVMVLGLALAIPGGRSVNSGTGATGDVARIDRHVVKREAFELAVQRQKESPWAMYMGGSGPTQELAIRNMVLDQYIDQFLKLDAARRERNQVGRQQLADRIEQAVDGEIQQAKAYFKTDKDYQEKFLKKRMKVENEEGLRKKLRQEYRRNAAWMAAIREQILIENLQAKIEKQAANVPLDKVKPEDTEVQVRQILVKAEKRSDAAAKKLAQEILDQITAGMEFAKVAKERSEDEATKAKGGDMGWIAKGGFWQGPELEKAALELQPGKVSGLIKTAQGYHILKVEGRRLNPAKHWAEYTDGLKKKAKIVVNDTALNAFRQMMAEAKDDAERKKNREQALSMFQKALDEAYLNDLRASIFYTIGSLHQQDGNLAKAAEAFGQAVNERPAPEIYMALGDAQKQLKKTKAAVESYTNASEMASDTSSQQDFFTHMMLRGVFEEMKETQLAAKEKAWIDEYQKNQPADGGMGFPGGTFTVP